MIPLKAVFVISILFSGLIFSPSYSFAQSDNNDNPLSSFFEILSRIFSIPGEPSSTVEEFGEATVIQTSGTSSTTDTTPNNILPIAEAGSNQTVNEFANVILNGSNSTDMDGTIISYNWTQISGPANVTLIDDDKAEASFTAPDVDGQGIFEFLLAVVDNSSGTDTDTVQVTVNENDGGSEGPSQNNLSPIADAGLNQTVIESQNVFLDGTNSTDPDGTIGSYQWSQVSGPSVTLLNNNTATASFEAPSVSETTVLQFLLAVVDNSSATDTDTVWVTVNEKDDDSDNDEDPIDPKDRDDQNKVTICHIPPGNPENAHTITVGESAVVAHMTQHGDTLGPCPDEPQNQSNDKSNSGKGNSEEKSNSGKGNSEEKSNSGRGNSNNNRD